MKNTLPILHRKSINIGIILTLLIVLGMTILENNNLKLEMCLRRIGTSTCNLHYEVLDYYDQKAFHDSWSIFAVKIKGVADGSAFDINAMNEGIGSDLKEKLGIVSADLKAAGKTDFGQMNLSESRYMSKAYLTDNAMTAIIYDKETEMYFVIQLS